MYTPDVNGLKRFMVIKNTVFPFQCCQQKLPWDIECDIKRKAGDLRHACMKSSLLYTPSNISAAVRIADWLGTSHQLLAVGLSPLLQVPLNTCEKDACNLVDGFQ